MEETLFKIVASWDSKLDSWGWTWTLLIRDSEGYWHVFEVSSCNSPEETLISVKGFINKMLKDYEERGKKK